MAEVKKGIDRGKFSIEGTFVFKCRKKGEDIRSLYFEKRLLGKIFKLFQITEVGRDGKAVQCPRYSDVLFKRNEYIAHFFVNSPAWKDQ